MEIPTEYIKYDKDGTMTFKEDNSKGDPELVSYIDLNTVQQRSKMATMNSLTSF